MGRRWLLDTSALLALRDDEARAAEVAATERLASAGNAECLACFMTRMEVLYRVWMAALHNGATLNHKDPEFQALAAPAQEWLE